MASINYCFVLCALFLFLVLPISLSAQDTPYGESVLDSNGKILDQYGSHELRLVTNDSASHSVDANENGIIDYAEHLANVPPGQSVITGIGTLNYLAQFTSTKTIGNSIIHSDGTTVTIGSVLPKITLSLVSPNAELHLDGKDYSAVNFYDNGFQKWGIGKFPSSGGNYFYIDESGIDSRLVIRTGGNIGIGTKTPREKLEVNGDVIISGISSCDSINGKLYTDTDGKILCGDDQGSAGSPGDINGGGTAKYIPVFKAQKNIGDSNIYMDGNKIGINTITPNTELDVNGNLTITGAKNCNSLSGKLYTDATGKVICGTDYIGNPELWTVGTNPNDIKNTNSGKVLVGPGTPPAFSNLAVSGSTYAIMTIDSGLSSQSSSVDFYAAGAPKWGIGKNSVDDFYIDESNAASPGNRMTIKSGGNVGIGVPSPSQKLEVSGYIKSTNLIATDVSGCTGNNQKIIIDGTGKLICSTDQNTLGNWSSLLSNIYNSNIGNVGIGLNNPSQKLEVSGYIKSTNIYPTEVSGCTGAGNKLIINGGKLDCLPDPTGSGYWSVINVNDIINSNSGNVGIGTVAAPKGYAKLDVDTSNSHGIRLMDSINGGLLIGYLGSTIQARTTTDQNTANLILQQWGGSVGIGTTTPVTHTGQNGLVVNGVGRGMLEIWSDNGAGKGILQQVGSKTYVGNLGTATSGWIAGNDVEFSAGGGAIAATILGANGYVGIGTTAPVRRLDVAGDIRVNTNIYAPTGGTIGFLQDSGAALPVKVASLAITSAYVNNAPANGLYVQGNVGIGTTTPGEKLQVVGKTTLSRVGQAECCSGGDYTLALSEDTSTSAHTATIQFHNAGVSEAYLRLANSGAGQRRFQIGDYQSAYTGLQMQGPLWVDGTQNSYLMGNVGIAKTNPQYSLDVNGDVRSNNLCDAANNCASVKQMTGYCQLRTFPSGTLDDGYTFGPAADWHHNTQTFRVICNAGEQVMWATPSCGDRSVPFTAEGDGYVDIGCTQEWDVALDSTHSWHMYSAKVMCCKVA